MPRRPSTKAEPTFEETIRKLSEGIRRGANSPNIHGYIPHAKQLPFHNASEQGRLYIGGNRSGKTTGGICEDIWWLTGRHPYRVTSPPPIRGRIVGVDFLDGVDKILKPELARWIPLSDLKGGSWETAYSKEQRTLTLENGSFVEFMCVDSQTEVLTRRGWKRRYELEHGDDMLTLNPETKKTEWHHIDTIYTNPNYKGNMVKFNPYSKTGVKMTIDALVTPNHKWVTHRGIKRTDNLLVTDKIQLVAECSEDPQSTFSDEYVALCGWIGGDGAVFNDGARIYQSHVNFEKQEKIEQLIKLSGYKYTTWQNDIYKMWKIYGQFQKQLDVTLLTAQQREIYLEALLLSDGTIEPTGKWQFTNTDIELIDLVMMLGILCGYRVSMSERPCSEWGNKQVYLVMGRAKNGNGRNPNMLKVENAKTSTVYYEGMVWCPGSPNLTFIARRNGTVYITGNSYEQDVEKFAGTSRHFVHFDEEPPREIWIENKARLIDTGGSWWITMTPVEGMTWVYEEVYQAGKLTPVESNIKVVEVDMRDNPHLNQGEVESFLSGLDKDDREARGKGKFIRIGGLVYKHFNTDIHVIDPMVPPKTWEWYASMDHGYNNPTCWLWHAVSPDGVVITFAEHYQAEMTVDEHATIVHMRNTGFGRTPDLLIGDPAIAQRQGVTGVSIQQAYAELGLGIVSGNNDVLAGINRINQYLNLDSEGHPRWYITRNCVNLINEMQKLRWKTFASKKLRDQNNKQDVIHKKDDHAPDAARYFFISLPDLGPSMPSMDSSNKESIAKSIGAVTPMRDVTDRNLHDLLARAGQGKTTEWDIQYQSDEVGYF